MINLVWCLTQADLSTKSMFNSDTFPLFPVLGVYFHNLLIRLSFSDLQEILKLFSLFRRDFSTVIT